MSNYRYRREGYIISVEDHRARGGAPGLRFRFGDLRDGKPVPFVMSNGVAVNPAPFLTIFRAQQGNTEKNDEINEETLRRLGYTGDHKSVPTVDQFRSGATRPNPVPVEIVWEVTEYGNEVQGVREVVSAKKEAGSPSAFFANAKLPQEKEPWEDPGKDPTWRRLRSGGCEEKEPWEEERNGNGGAGGGADDHPR